MRATLAAVLFTLSSAAAAAQPAVPVGPPPVDLQVVAVDEQAVISAVRHNDENLSALVREIMTLRTENKHLSEELEKLSSGTK